MGARRRPAPRLTASEGGPVLPRRRTLAALCALFGVLALSSGCARTAPSPARTAAAATGTDAAAFAAALRQASETGKAFRVPAGTYAVGGLSVPDGVTIVGAGKDVTWLKGELTFGSNDVISGLRIGDAGASAVHNQAGATGTTFERCRFRGGGGAAYTSVVDLGSGAPCSRVTFVQCDVERNLGEEDDRDQGYNDVSILVRGEAQVRDITFDGCHIGVTNDAPGGRTTGSPRFGLEAYDDPSTAAGRGWQDITLRDCVFEAADRETADFSDTPTARSSGVLIEGCTFKGGGFADGSYRYTLNLEMPLRVVVHDNTFLRGEGSYGYVLNVTGRRDAGYTGPGAVFVDNLFDLDTDDGIPEVNGIPIVLEGDGNRFSGNTVRCQYG